MRTRPWACLAVVALALAHAADGEPCSVARVASPKELVRRSHAIVRAVAQGYTAEPKPMFDDEKVRKAMGNMLRAGTIRFAVLEVLKGSAVSPELEMRGVLVDWDDINDQKTVPYTFVRPDGRRGTCYANTYRTGAEYLLFLSRDASGYGLYDAALAPINEQVRGADDPWAAWVRRRAGTRARHSP